MTTDRTKRTVGAAAHMTDTDIKVLRQLYDECTLGTGRAPAYLPDSETEDPTDGTPCTLGELKAYLGATRRPPISAGSVHLVVTGQTHAGAPGKTFPPKHRDGGSAPGEGEHTVVVTETYRVGKGRPGENGRQRTSKRDTAVLLSRRAVRGTGEKGHIVSITRLVEVTRDGVVVNPGRPLIVEGTTIEGNRELKPGRVLDAMCDPELVLDGQPNGLKDEQ